MPVSYKCDGVPDCDDRTDEVGCPPRTGEVEDPGSMTSPSIDSLSLSLLSRMLCCTMFLTLLSSRAAFSLLSLINEWELSQTQQTTTQTTNHLTNTNPKHTF